MVLLFEKQYPDIDTLKLIKICIIHDLGEAISGDIVAVDQIEGVDKGIQEMQDLELLLQPLPNDLKEEILILWDDYENASSQEALLAKAFDKIETILQHTQGQNPPNFNYGFNLS
jgi:putative hydrolase of HD superfamily